MHLKPLCIPAALVCLLAQQAVARNIFVTPGQTATGVSTFSAEPFSYATTVGPVSGAFSVIGSASATKFYSIAQSATDSVVVLEGRFPLVTVGARLSVGGTPAAAAVTPDGRYIVVVGSPGIAIIDTSADRVTTTMGNIDAGGDAIDVAAGIDGSHAYVLSATASRLTAVDPVERRAAGRVDLTSRPTAVAVGPNGIIYVSAANTIYEIDPGTLAIRAAIAVVGTPGKLSFTPNGRFAIAPSASTAGGRGAFLLNLAARTVTDIASASYSLTDVALVSDSLAYGVSSQGTIYAINIGSDGTITAQLASFGGSTVSSNINEVAGTGELPAVRYLVFNSGSNLYRLDVQNNQMSDPVVKPSPGNLSMVTPTGQGGAFGHLVYNATQTAASGTASQPLVVRVHDQSGLPVGGVPVVFSTSTPGVTLGTASVTSNLEGYASTVVNVPSTMTTGAITVNASIQAGQRSATFTVNVGDPMLPGPGTGPGPGPVVPTGLNIVSGHGYVVSAQFPTNPGVIRVRLTDSNGAAVSNAQITWSLAQGGGNIQPLVSTTDSNGEATTTFISSGIQPGLPYQLNVLNAAAPNGQRVELFILALPLMPTGPGAIDPLWPTERRIVLKAGEIRQGAIQVRASIRGTSFPAPYVGLRLVQTNVNSPNFQCRGGIVLTDQQGLASCDVIAGAQRGEFGVSALLGEVVSTDFTIVVEQGDAAEVRIQSGNNQTLLQGQTSQPFVVEVRDPAGNPLPNVPLTWEYPFFFPTPQSIQQTTDINGRASASFVMPSDRTGPFSIRAIAGNASATFTVTVGVAAAGIAPVSGGDQTAVVNQAFAQPLQVRVTNAQNQPVQNASVTFAVTAGSATLSPASATTGADGLASTTVTAGATAGAVTVTATSGSQTTTFNLTVRLAGPVFTASDIVNAAGYFPGISPGSIAYIRARGIAPNVRGSVTPGAVVAPLPLRLSDVEVLFNQTPAPVYAVSNINGEESVIVQVPFETSAGTANVTIRSSGGGSTTVPVTILPVKPGVFTYTDVNGSVYAVATRPDGSYISAANPARRGEEIRIYATGLGQTSPAAGTNRVGIPGQLVSSPVIAGINNAGVRVRSAELQEGTVGVYVITMEIPSDTLAGPAQPVGLGVTGPDGQVVFANSANIPVV